MDSDLEHKVRNVLIRTPDHRLRVFVSSTLRELEAERKSVNQAISKLHLAPVMFESGARPHPAQDLYQAYLNQSHIFIGIYWQSYGWIGPGMEISGLEDEYNRSAGLPRLIYIKKPSPSQDLALKTMLERIRNDDTSSYKYFESPDELMDLVENDLILLLTEYFETARASEQHAGVVTPSVLTTVPIPRNPLIGREFELETATDLLLREEVAMLTLTGSAGAGKSRLGIQIALNLSGHFADGIFLVALESVQDASLVIPTIAKTLEVRESAERLTLLDTLNAYLCTRYVLLLLDNYEHLLSSALQIAELLEACPHAKILVTSRSPLRIRAERILDVPPLSIPPAQKHLSREQLFQYSAFQLFVQRAQSVKMDFQVTDENAQAVRDICHKLDGLPLAIELAAAWIKILTPQALLTRLEKRFLILRGGTRDLPERQQTMYKAIDWSYNLLSEKDKCLLQYLSVFAGGWTFESAETVCSNGVLCSMDIFDGVETLMSNNLLKPPEEVGKELRMKQFEAIREFAHDHLLLSEESEAVHLRYMQYFLSLAEQAEDELVQSSQQVWNKRISVELDNFRAVMSWAIEHNKNEVALQITNALWRFWWSHGYWSENLQWLTASLNGSGPVSNELKARALTQAGWLYRHMGYFAQAISMLQESLMLWKHANHPAGLAMTLTCLGASALGQGDTEQAMTYLEQAYQLSENQDSMLVKYVVKEYLGHIASRRGDVQSAIERYNESLAMAELVNDDSHIAKILNALGDEYVIDGKYDQAEECFSRAAMICNKLGNRIVGAYIMGNRGIIAMKRGDYSAAYNLLSKSISEVQELGDKVRAILCLGHFAYIAKEQQQLDRAVNILGASDKLRKAIGLTLSQPMEADFKAIVAYLINQLGKDAFITAWTNGSSMTYDQAVAYALQQES